MWWNKNDEKLTYVSYQIGNSEVLVGPRLTARGCSLDFFNSINAWLVVTESYVEYPISANVRWFPWKEALEPFPDHVLYGSLKMLNFWINELNLSKIYIHCDLGSHRAPTVLGAFLFAYFKEKQDKIINERKVINPEQSTIVSQTGEIHGNPQHYFNSYLKQLPLMETMINTILKHPQAPLDEILRLSFDSRPLSVYTFDELVVYEAEQKSIEKNKRLKKLLRERGFVFECDPKHVSIFNADTPKGNSHIIGDNFFPDMYDSLKKYSKVFITSASGLSVLKERISDIEVKEFMNNDDIEIFYVELNLTNY